MIVFKDIKQTFKKFITHLHRITVMCKTVYQFLVICVKIRKMLNYTESTVADAVAERKS